VTFLIEKKVFLFESSLLRFSWFGDNEDDGERDAVVDDDPFDDESSSVGRNRTSFLPFETLEDALLFLRTEVVMVNESAQVG
jgi:hypothetical protein